MTADPKAMQHILHKSGYNWPKRRDTSKLAEVFAGGPGITSAAGEAHQRQRKIMNPAFSAAQLRGFLPLFQSIGTKLCEKWEKDIVPIPDKTVYVNKWLARATLDILGAAAFDYDYGAIDETENALAKSYSTLFVDAALHPSAGSILFRTMWHYLPDWVIDILKRSPNRMLKRAAETSSLFREVAGRLLKEKESEMNAKAEDGHKDVLSILVKANASEEPKGRLSDDEMKAQMQTLTLAGHETTASTVSWLLWELAKNPDYQTRLRAEIRAAREATVEHLSVTYPALIRYDQDVFNCFRKQTICSLRCPTIYCFALAGIRSDCDKKQHALRYAPESEQSLWRSLPDFSDPSTSYADFKRMILEEYVGADGWLLFTVEHLEDQVSDAAQTGFRTHKEFTDSYSRRSRDIAAVLTRTGYL
ncbi:cytochrome P450 [Earliella scabrosa]|nr:cytochrome P450 [Earliella scabrosa]